MTGAERKPSGKTLGDPTDFSVLAAASSEQFVDITLETGLEDIPAGGPCEVCDHPTQKKTFLQQVSTGADLRVRASVAGYRCQNPECGISSYSNEALVEAFTKASGIFANSGDMATAAAFDRRIEIERRFIALSHQTEAESARGA